MAFTTTQKTKVITKVERLVNSGQTVAAACKAVGVKTPTFFSWKRKTNGAVTNGEAAVRNTKVASACTTADTATELSAVLTDVSTLASRVTESTTELKEKLQAALNLL